MTLMASDSSKAYTLLRRYVYEKAPCAVASYPYARRGMADPQAFLARRAGSASAVRSRHLPAALTPQEAVSR